MLRNLPRACRRARPELVEGGLILRCGHCLHRRPSIPQLQQTRNQGVVVVLGPLTLRPCRLNDMQNSAQPIHQLQQPADQLRTHGQDVYKRQVFDGTIFHCTKGAAEGQANGYGRRTALRARRRAIEVTILGELRRKNCLLYTSPCSGYRRQSAAFAARRAGDHGRQPDLYGEERVVG